jgi:hypothetical protein
MRAGGERQWRQQYGKDGCSGGRWWQQTTTAKADNNSGGQQWHVRLGIRLQRGWTRAGGKRRRKHGVAMMAAAADHGSSGHRQWQTTTMGMADNDSGRRRRRWTAMARKIGRRTMRGKEENRWQTTTALDKRLISLPGREREKIKNSSLHNKIFFQQYCLSGGFFAPAKTANVPFLVYQSYLYRGRYRSLKEQSTRINGRELYVQPFKQSMSL